MIVSALINECRREYNDVPKTTERKKTGDGSSTIYNLGSFPVVEGSYSVFKGTSAQVEGSSNDFILDIESGDLQLISATTAEIKVNFKNAHWSDQSWVDAVNQAIESLNGRGFFKQVVRQNYNISAGITKIDGPSACVDVNELTYQPISGTFKNLPVNWSYQSDANKVVLGQASSLKLSGSISYLRNLQTYDSSSAVIDVKSDWIELVKKKSGELFYRSLASQKASDGNASIDEGHFSFSNLRTMANDLDSQYERNSVRKKPTRPAKDMQYRIPGGGIA